MKKIILSLLLVFTFTLTTMAQDKTAEGAKVVTTHLKTQLSLNDGQYAKVYEINKTFLQKANDNNMLSINATEKTKKLKALMEEKDAKLKSVLTDVQFKTYAANRANTAKKLKEYYQEQ